MKNEKNAVQKLQQEVDSLKLQLENAKKEKITFIESSYDGYWDWHIQGDYEYMSPRFWEIFGIDPKTKKHKPSEWQNIIHPDDLKACLSNFERHVQSFGMHPYFQEVRYKHAKGHWCTVLCRGQVVEWDPNRKPLRMIGVHTDITALKIAEQQREAASQKLLLAEQVIEQKNKRLNTIFQSLSEGLVLQDKTGRIVEFNHAATKILGLSEAELLGRTSTDPRWVTQRPDRTPFPGREHPSMIALKTGNPQYHVPMIVSKPDGTSSWLSINAIPIFDAGNPVVNEVVVTFADISDHQKTQLELESTLKFIPAGIFKTDLAGSCTYVNDTWCKLTGISDVEAYDTGWTNALYPEDKDRVINEWSRSVSELLPWESVYRFQRVDGFIRHVHGKAMPLVDSSGTAIGYLGSIQDITSLKNAGEFNTFYKLALDKAAIVAFTDSSGKITYVNEMFCTVSGYNREELIGKDHRILNSGKMGKDFFRNMWKTISSGKQWHGEICNKAKNGSFYWVDSTIIPFLSSNGRIEKYISIRRDITIQKLQQIELFDANRNLENLKTRLEVALDGSHIGVWEWEVPNNKLIWDDQMFHIYGVPREQFSSAYDAWANGLHPDDSLKSQDELKLALDGKKEFNTEFRVIKGNGEICYVLGRAKVFRDSDGRPIRVIGINWDVTKIKENERALDQARKLADQASEAKAEFLASMSHEIRTPLNGIIGMTGLLQETSLTMNQLECANAISQSGKILLTIINDILDFSKIDAGKLEIEEVEFDLCAYIKDLLKPFSPAVQKKNITLSADFSQYDHFVWGDDGRIGQIVNNLVSNAIKFTKLGGVTVKSHLESHGDQTSISISINDTGIGIPEAAKERMFKAFSQADKSTSRNFGGTGLGLSISKRLVELMGGSIGFESQEGKGTTFTVRLNLRTGKKITTKCENQNQNQNQNQKAISGRILAAEDNATNQLFLGRMLQKWGCKYHMVANGNEVLDALREADYDLILMDCQMPEMDGYDATRIIRKSDSLKNDIPIIALTANAISGDQKKCREAGMNEYLSKPIDMKALEKMLRKYL